MAQWDEGLEGVHREIAADPAARLHVLAGPGTGKTFAMMRRIARLLSEGVSPEKLLAVSFTRTAARDLREQLAKLGVDGADKVRATTLHSLCFGLLSTEEAFKFTERVPRPLLSFEIDCLRADLADQFGGKREVDRLREAYEAAWARLQHDDPGHPSSQEDQLFETALLGWLRFHAAMLIGELVPLTLAFLDANPALPVLPILDHVLVDEYQDLNKADQALAHKLASPGAMLVIGDDNQSIYRFRYANPEGIRTFPTEVSDTTCYAIEECRRCPPNIVALSNSLISHDPHTSRPKPLNPSAKLTDADVHIVQHATLKDEIQASADFIDFYLQSHPEVPAGRMLVLTPRRFVGNAIRDALIAKGRNALSYFQEDALSEESAAEGFCLLTLLVNPDDRASIRAWLGFGSSDRRRRGYARLRQHCEQNAMPLTDALAALSVGTLRIPHTGLLVERWRLLQERLATLTGLTGLDLIKALWSKDDPAVRDVRNLAAAIAIDGTPNDDLLESLREAITQPELPGSDSDIIQVMSLHKSKGLTRDVVVIAGCMAGTLPQIDEKASPEEQSQQLDEQRRLFYVGITRATKALVISSAVKLPLANALASGARVVKRYFEGGESFARTAATAFIQELGASAPKTQTTAEFRAAVGLSN